jgi:two-component system LytT family response regulator
MGVTYKCLIVDDEKPAHLVLKSHIDSCRELEFIASAYNGKEAIEIIKQLQIDIIFLDIQMPLLNGIEVLEQLTEKPAIILTTAFSNFAFEAYQHDAIDYLLKPIHFSRFCKAIKKAKIYTDKFKNYACNTLEVKTNGNIINLKHNEIIYIQSIGNYVKIYTSTNTSTLLGYYSLKNLLNILPSNLFLQTHKSYIVNQNFVQTIDSHQITLTNRTIIPVGRKYKILFE